MLKCTLIVISCAVGSVSVAAQSFFTQLPAETQITGMSRDGTHAVGVQGSSVFKWSVASGLQTLAGGSGSVGNPSVSADGSLVAATAGNGHPEDPNNTAAVWRNNQWHNLTGAPGPSSAYGISPDGVAVVGLAAVEEGHVSPDVAAVWNTDGSGAVTYNTTAEGRSCRANVVSNGGAVVGGWQDTEQGFRAGALWHKGVQTILRDSTGSPVGEVLGMNSAGTVFTGYNAAGRSAWLMLPGDKAPRILNASSAFATSEDGKVVGGSVGEGFSRTGFIWTPDGGVEPLLSALHQRGVPLPVNITETELGSVVAVSGDGMTLAGWGMKMGVGPTAWVAHVDTEESVLHV